MIDLEILPFFGVGGLMLGTDCEAVHAALGEPEHRQVHAAGDSCSTDFWLGARFQVHYEGTMQRQCVEMIEMSLDPRFVPRLFGYALFATKVTDLVPRIAARARAAVEVCDRGAGFAFPALEVALRRTARGDEYFSEVAVGRFGSCAAASMARSRT